MTFQEAVRTALQEKYADFQSRSSRAEYWWYVLFALIVNLVMGLLAEVLGGLGDLLSFLVAVALFVPGLAVTIRRFHDIGRSGWWTLVLLIPIVNIVLILIWFTKPGTDGPNEYGPDPRAAPA